MQRKLIAQKDSHTITLPKKWVQENGLSSGSDLFVEQVNNSLLLSATKSSAGKTIEVQLTKEIVNTVKIILWTIYRQGYDIATIHYALPQQREEILRAIPSLLGFEIVEDADNKLIIESITEPSETKDELILRRLFLLNKQLLEITFVDAQNKSLSQRMTVIEITEKISQYDKFLKRNLSKSIFPSSSSYYSWSVIQHLLLLSRSIFHLYESSLKLGSFSTEMQSIFHNVKEAFSLLYEGFFASDMEKTHKGSELARIMLREFLLDEIKTSEGDTTLFLHFVCEFTQIIYHMASSTQGIIFARSVLDGKKQRFGKEINKIT